MRPAVWIEGSCWDTVVAELDRVAPDEGVLLPLVGLRRPPGSHPCNTIDLEELLSITIADVVRIPAHLQRNSSVLVSLLPGTDAWLDGELAARVAGRPALRSAAYLHSHPFAVERTWPSAGDIQGHMVPLLRRNREAALNSSFSFIACRSRTRGWRLQCFALDGAGRVVDLGFAEPIAADHGAVMRALAPSLRRRPDGAALKKMRQVLKRCGYRATLDELFDGWMRLRVNVGARVLVGLFAQDFRASTNVQWFLNQRGHTTAIRLGWQGLLSDDTARTVVEAACT